MFSQEKTLDLLLLTRAFTVREYVSGAVVDEERLAAATGGVRAPPSHHSLATACQKRRVRGLHFFNKFARAPLTLL